MPAITPSTQREYMWTRLRTRKMQAIRQIPCNPRPHMFNISYPLPESPLSPSAAPLQRGPRGRSRLDRPRANRLNHPAPPSSISRIFPFPL